MFDDFSRRTKAVRATFELAEQRGWNAISLADIAGRAGLGLADLRREFTCKMDILKAFQAELDAKVLARVKPGSAEQSPRDRLFDILMTRFELMAPYKPALKRIAADFRCRPGEGAELLCTGLISQYWMLAGAGAKLGGPGTGIKVAGIAGIYARVFGVWLDDDTPGLDRTMAALDRKLSKGEEMLASMEKACETLRSFACAFAPRGFGRREEKPAA